MNLALCELADGRLASAGWDGRVCIWSTGGGTEEEQEPVRLEGHDDPVKALCELADGRLASAGDDGRVCIWSTGGGREEEQEPVRLKGHDRAVKTLCELADGSRDHSILPQPRGEALRHVVRDEEDPDPRY